MRAKSKLTIIALFSCCAITSMGFANWVISQETPPQDIYGSIQADTVVLSDDYLRLQEGFPIAPSFTVQGFSSDSTGYSYACTMTVQYTMNVELCQKIYGENFTVDITLGYSDSFTVSDTVKNLFAEGKFLSGTIEVGGKESSNGNDGFSDGGYNIQLKVDDSMSSNAAEAVIVKVTYQFDFGTYENFRAYFYAPFVTQSDLQFKLEAKLIGTNLGGEVQS